MEQLALIDLDVDRVRAEAAAGAQRSGAAAARIDREEATFSVSARDFVRGAVEAPEAIDLDDYERCVGKVVLALRRGGERLAGATLQVRYHAGTGCVTSITLQRAGEVGTGSEVYRREDAGHSATA
ncbi:hypothetical protein K2Z84_18375 [Candidatus Binatia bacterium]|nr:hypothetical protein [Candidatus Binatia bacterium]